MSSFLQSRQRQPKLFIDLPSGGKYYDDTVIKDQQYTQIPVYGMNAMDEIMFKTPDALFTGEATVRVVQSCVPAILDPWKIVGFDIDYILIAIRIATYGDELPIQSSCPHCEEENESVLSLTNMLDGYSQYQTDYQFEIEDYTFNLKPITYRQLTDFAMQNYQFERTLVQIAANKDLDPKKKTDMQNDVYIKSNELNIRLAISYIANVMSNGEVEEDTQEITDFIVNNEAVFYNRLKEGIFDLSARWNVPNIQLKCAAEECEKDYETKIDMDYANFFGLKFLRSRTLI